MNDFIKESASARAVGHRRVAKRLWLAALMVGAASAAFAIADTSQRTPERAGAITVVSAPTTEARPLSAQSVPGGQAQAAAAAGCTPPARDVAVVHGSDGVEALTLNGTRWRPKGLQIRAFVTSLEYAHDLISQGDNSGQTVIDAQNAYGQGELNAARTFGADELRFQVSQWALTHPEYNPGYLGKVKGAIDLARCSGFVVILSMQAEDRSGPDSRTSISSADTKDAWMPLVKAYGRDLGVMLEIYNEPSGAAVDGVWKRWGFAGAGQFAGLTEQVTRRRPADNSQFRVDDVKIFGMQPMINYLRNGVHDDSGTLYRANNVVILDGLDIAKTFNNFGSALGSQNPFTDPLDGTKQIIYAVHPYLRSPGNISDAELESRFDDQFGGFNKVDGHYLLATEWSAREGSDGLGLGTPPNWRLAVTALNYLIKKNIFMSAGAFDAPGIMTQNVSNFNPTTYNNYCAERTSPGSKNDAGLLVRAMFARGYDAPVTLQDGINDNVTSTAPCS